MTKRQYKAIVKKLDKSKDYSPENIALAIKSVTRSDLLFAKCGQFLGHTYIAHHGLILKKSKNKFYQKKLVRKIFDMEVPKHLVLMITFEKGKGIGDFAFSNDKLKIPININIDVYQHENDLVELVATVLHEIRHYKDCLMAGPYRFKEPKNIYGLLGKYWNSDDRNTFMSIKKVTKNHHSSYTANYELERASELLQGISEEKENDLTRMYRNYRRYLELF